MKDFSGHKTIKVQDLRLCVNKLLANKKICESEKAGYCFLLERVLFDTNNYKGYNNIRDAAHDYERWYY